MAKRTLYLEVVVDWEDYEDVCDELLLEDTGILDRVMADVSIKLIPDPYQLKIKFPENEQ